MAARLNRTDVLRETADASAWVKCELISDSESSIVADCGRESVVAKSVSSSRFFAGGCTGERAVRRAQTLNGDTKKPGSKNSRAQECCQLEA